MKALLTDPVVLICSGIIFVGLIAFFWALGRIRKPSYDEPRESSTDGLIPMAPELPEIEFRAPALAPRNPAPVMSAMSAAPPVSKDVADRLESMSQRLSEMQSVLTKQSSSAPAPGGAAAGGVGQGFSPETIDKLLKIIGNVIQQVDILQKNLNITK